MYSIVNIYQKNAYTSPDVKNMDNVNDMPCKNTVNFILQHNIQYTTYTSIFDVPYFLK